MPARIIFFYIFCLSLLSASCVGDGDKPQELPSETELKERLIKANKVFVEKENDRINSYIARHKYDMLETGTGLRYQILTKVDGEKAVEGDKVIIAYTLTLLNGEMIVGENGADTTSFTIGKSDIPSGINEGVQLMHKGERARFILPTHLGFGLTGDEERVPSNAALIYNLQLIEVIKSNKK